MGDNQEQSAREDGNNGLNWENLLQDHEDDNDLAPSSVPDSIDYSPRQST